MNVLTHYEIHLSPDLLKNVTESYDIEHLHRVKSNCDIPLPPAAKKEDRTVSSFINLHTDLENFLGPLKHNIMYLLSFDDLKSTYIQHLMAETYFMSETRIATPTVLSEAIQYCMQKVRDAIVDGSVCLKEMSLDMNSTKEVTGLAKFVRRHFGSQTQYGAEGFKALNSMSHFQQLIVCLSELFLIFDLKNCISAPKFQELMSDCQRLQNPISINLKEAVELQNALYKIFPHTVETCEELFHLLQEIKKTELYVNFCKQKGFAGESGKRLFLTKYNFLLQEIHDLAEQHAVDALWMAYHTIFLFIDEEVDFNTFCRHMHTLGNTSIMKKISQLKALQYQNLPLLEKCFMRDEVCMCSYDEHV